MFGKASGNPSISPFVRQDYFSCAVTRSKPRFQRRGAGVGGEPDAKVAAAELWIDRREASRTASIQILQIDPSLLFGALISRVENPPEALVLGKSKGLEIGVLGNRHQLRTRFTVLRYYDRSRFREFLYHTVELRRVAEAER